MPRTPAAAFLAVPVVGGATMLLRTQGVYGVFWCYPAVMVCYCILRPRVAAACSLALLAAAAALIDARSGAGPALRFALSLGAVIGIVTVMLNRRGTLERRLAEDAIRDPLTGAFNRRHMDACLATAIERRRRSGERASLLLFDIDRFKDINDAVGHASGDQVLKAVVALVGQRARRLDVLFRIGGEEFALLVAGARFSDALRIAESLRALVAGAGLLEGRQVSISIGVSELRHGQSADAWIEEADAALYRAKRAGRNRVAGVSPEPGCPPHETEKRFRISVPM